MNLRALAAGTLVRVTQQGRSLDAALAESLTTVTEPRDRALLRQLCAGTLRWQPRLAWFAGRLLREPLKARDADLQALLLVGIYQLAELRIPDHAAVAETVEGARALGKPWATKLVNGVLRSFLRQADALAAAADRVPEARYAHPAWLLARLQRDWPDHWQAVTEANNRQPPLTLRLNRRKVPDREAYLARLAAAGHEGHALPGLPDAITLESPCDVRELPGFAAGEVSVQDGSAQRAAELLALAPGQRVLDACAAPGGKTAHLLELEPALAEVVALDISADRLQRVTENLERLQLQATLCQGDAGQPGQWWDGRPFDRILLDAPCSATGVIRRNPDIKLLRRPGDIAELAARQYALLTALWPLLAPGGMLLYATCSILPQENTDVLEQFLATQPEAVERPMDVPWGLPQTVGRQILPGPPDEQDGFYYARLVRT